MVATVRPTFLDSVERWSDRDFGEDLRSFLDEICYTDLDSYEQLICHKDAIVCSLLRRLANRSPSLPAFFDFCYSIATDLRDDFQPHFWQIFDAISNLLLASKEHRKFDGNELEGAFRAMRQIVRVNLRFVYSQQKRLFSRLLRLFAFPSDERLRSLSARTFSFIFSEVPSPHKLAKFLLVKCFSGRVHLRDGLSLFFFDSFLCVGENEAKLGELIDALIVSTFAMPSDSQLRRFSVSFLNDLFRKCFSGGKHSISTQLLLKLQKCFENAQHTNEVQTLIQWLLLWINTKKDSQSAEVNGKNLLPLVVAQLQSHKTFTVDLELFEQYLQLLSALLLSLPPSLVHHSSVFVVLANFGTDWARLPRLLRCLALLCSQPLFLTSVMQLVGRVGSSLFASIPTDFGIASQEQLQLVRELLAFYKNAFSRLVDESSFSLSQTESFCVTLHPIRNFVAAVLQNPSVYPSDFFNFALLIWPHCWLISEKPEGFDAIDEFVVQSIRKGTTQRLTEKETESLWNATNAIRSIEQRRKK